MNATDFFAILKETKLESFSIINGKLNGDQIFPSNVTLGVERKKNEVFVVKPYSFGATQTKGIITYGGFECETFKSMTISESLICFETVNSGFVLKFNDSNEVKQFEEVVVLDKDFVWARRGDASRFVMPRLNIPHNYSNIANPCLHGKTLISFETVVFDKKHTVVYNRKTNTQIFRENSQNIFRVGEEAGCLIFIEYKDYSRKYLTADGIECETF